MQLSALPTGGVHREAVPITDLSLFYLLLTEFCLASFQCKCARGSLLYLTPSLGLWPHSLEKRSTDSDAAGRHRDMNLNTRAGRHRQCFYCWLYPGKRGSGTVKANSSWYISQHPGQQQLLPAVAPLRMAASGMGQESRVTLSSAITAPALQQ